MFLRFNRDNIDFALKSMGLEMVVHVNRDNIDFTTTNNKHCNAR